MTQPLTAMRLGQDAALVVPFTTEDEDVTVHYADYPDIKGYVRCAGDGCLLCQLEKRRDTRHLLPVFYPRDNRMAVLPVPPSHGLTEAGVRRLLGLASLRKVSLFGTELTREQWEGLKRLRPDVELR